MSKKIVAKSATPDTMEIFEAVKLLEKEKGITSGMLLERIKNAIAIAVRRDMGRLIQKDAQGCPWRVIKPDRSGTGKIAA